MTVGLSSSIGHRRHVSPVCRNVSHFPEGPELLGQATMPKSLAKVQKRIAKKKGHSNSLHENSRDAQRLRRAGARSEKLDKLAAARAKANQPYCSADPHPQMDT